MREDSRAEVSNAFVNKHSGSNRPARNHLTAAQQFFIVWSSAFFPEQFSIGSSQAINKTVIRTKEYPVFPDSWCQANGTAGKERPMFLSRGCIEGVNFGSDDGFVYCL